jgi:hypothetical protein
MFTKIKEFLFGKPAEVAAPYKIEAPAPVVETKPADERVEAPAPTVEAKPVTKAPAKKQQFEKKAAAPKEPAKPKAPAKPRTPRNTAAK